MTYQIEKSGKIKPMTPEELAAADAGPPMIAFNQGTLDDGTFYWVYIAIKPSKYTAFLQATMAHQPIRIKDYGTILKFGFDKAVPLAIKEEMERTHGCDDNYLAKLAEDVKIKQVEFLKNQENQRIGDIVAMLKKNKPAG